MRTCRPLVLACLLLARPGVGRPMVRTAAATSGWTELQEAQGTAGDQRDITGDQRDITGDQRDITGDQRDITGDRRDITGDQRDITGDERDITGDQWDITGDQQDITEAASYIVALKPEGILEAFDVVSKATSQITRDVVVGPAVGEDPVVTESYQNGQLEDGSAVSAEAGDDPATPTYTDDEDPDTYVQIPEEEPSADGEDNAEELDPAGRISEEGLPSEHTQSEVEEAGRDLPKTTDRIGSGLDSVASAGDGEPVSSRASSEDVPKGSDHHHHHHDDTDHLFDILSHHIDSDPDRHVGNTRNGGTEDRPRKTVKPMRPPPGKPTVAKPSFSSNFNSRPDKYHLNAHQHGNGTQQQTVVNVFGEKQEISSGPCARLAVDELPLARDSESPLLTEPDTVSPPAGADTVSPPAGADTVSPPAGADTVSPPKELEV